MPIDFEWLGDLIDLEIRELHAEAFETRVHIEADLNWRTLVNEHSLGWVVARNGRRLVGFANVPWDPIIALTDRAQNDLTRISSKIGVRPCRGDKRSRDAVRLALRSPICAVSSTARGGTRKEAYAALRSYSWIRPPSRSRTIDPVASAAASGGPHSGIRRSRPRWGRSRCSGRDRSSGLMTIGQFCPQRGRYSSDRPGTSITRADGPIRS
jgi:hypothetical protein